MPVVAVLNENSIPDSEATVHDTRSDLFTSQKEDIFLPT
jgi:hypothetical protein